MRYKEKEIQGKRDTGIQWQWYKDADYRDTGTCLYGDTVIQEFQDTSSSSFIINLQTRILSENIETRKSVLINIVNLRIPRRNPSVSWVEYLN